MLGQRLTQLLGIRYPILQGAMAWISDASLAAAVSNAGGLGIIAAGNMPAEMLEQELVKVRALTDKPFALNIMLMSSTASDAVELAAKHRVPVVTTGAGSPGKVIDRLKPLGTIVMPVVATGTQAKRVAKQGADAVIAEGCEAGGHIGELTTMALTPMVVSSVDIPVVTAGGVVDGRGMAAAFALGASGVQVGTRFLCATECNVHENYKNAVIGARERATSVTGRTLGHPVRCLSNKLTARYDELERVNAPAAEVEALGTGKLKAAVVDGDVETGSLMAGQVAALVNKIEPARDIVESLMSDMESVLRSLGSKL